MKKAALVYIALAYLLTWSYAFTIYALYRSGALSANELNLLHAFAAAGPAISAVIVALVFYGNTGLGKLLGRLRPVRISWETRLIVWSPFILLVLGLLLYPVLTGIGYDFYNFFQRHLFSYQAIMIWLLPLVTYPVLEEIGWRGFLLPHLQESHSAWISSCILAAVWGLWHLPFFFYRFDFSLFMAVGFFFGIFVGTIILTYIFNSGRGFLMPVIFFHFANNFCSGLDKQLIPMVLSSGFILIAIWIYRFRGRQHLSAVERTKNFYAE
jgi:membrane protease YdiL (CAAX protease family)